MDEFISEIGSGDQPIDATVTITGTIFSDNTATTNGGEIVENAGVVTVDGVTDTIVIGGIIYTGDAYSQDQIGQAFVDKQIVAAQDVTLAGFTVTTDKEFVGDEVSMSGNTVTENGGAIYNLGTATITDSTFTRNSAQWNGGAIYNSANTATVTGSTFTDNSAYYGGAICNDTSGGIIMLVESAFAGNTAGDGGAIYTYKGCAATITGGIFIGNSATSDGGAIYGNESTMTISRSTFAGNTADLGGAIYSYYAAADISDSTFTGNTAKRYGGAGYFAGFGRKTISGSTFSDNTAGVCGGAIYNVRSGSVSVTITECIFTGNKAEKNGGAIYNEDYAELTISGSTFSGNSAATNGGAVYNTATTIIRDSVFATQTDTIYSTGTLTLGGTVTTAANITSTNAITVEEDIELVLDLSVYEGTTSKELLTSFDTMFGTTQSDLSITVNVASDQAEGTYILATNASQFDLSKTISVVCNGNEIGSFNLQGGTTSFVSDGRNYTLRLDNDTLSFSAEESDTAIVTTAGTTTELTIGTTTYRGKAYPASQIGQALMEKQTVAVQGVSYENKNLTVTVGTTLVADVITMSNGIAGFGGAIADRGYMTVTKGLFSGNRADNDGGAVSIDGTAAISGSTFAANSAKRGGAIYVGDTALIAGCTFTGNAASTGGAIYIGAGAETTIKDSVFAKRYDTIYNQGGAVTLEGIITLAAKMDGGSYTCSANGVDLVFVNSEQVSVSNLAETGNLRRLAFHGTQEVSFSDLTLTDTSISIKCGLPDPDAPVTVATGISSLGNGAITVNGSIARDGIVFVDGVFCTVGLDDNNLQVRRADSVEAAIVCPAFKKGTIGEVTINGVRYSGLVYEDISSASVNSSIVAVQGGTTIYRQTILANSIGVIDNYWFNNATTTVGTGAAINLGNNSKTTITGSTFTICYNNSTHGGAIGAESGAEVTLRSCIFASNTSSGSYGGAIYAGTNSLMTMTGCTFTGNTAAQHAGAIVVDRCGTLDISDCIFAGNIAANGNGGVINLQREGMVTITGCTFTANTAGLARTGNGGAIYVGRDSKLLVSDCVFSGNVVVTDAGAIYTNGTATQTTIKNCIFATKSDSLHLDSGTVTFAGSITLAADLTVKSSYLYYSCSSEKVDFIFINDETISIARLSDTQNIRSIAFTGASPVKFTDLALSDTSISIDCALPALGESLTIAEGLTALGAGNMTVHNKNVVGGKAFAGDGLYKVTLWGNNLTVEAEEYVSAAIVTSNGAEWIRIGSTNYAGKVYATINEALAKEDFVVVQKCSFGTQSSVTGSVKRAAVDQNYFTQSVADNDGGALMISEGLVSITASTFSYNVAENGGAIANADGGELTIWGSTFTANTADVGGAVYNTGDHALITGSTFTGNTAKDHGGAIYNSGTSTIRDSIFATTADTVYNSGSMTLGGTIWTAANIYSGTAVTVEADTKIVLDFAVRTADMGGLLTDYAKMFGTSQDDLSISVNVAADQSYGNYVLATNAAGFDQSKTISVTRNGEEIGAFVLQDGMTFFGADDKFFKLALTAGGNLTLTVEKLSDTGIVTKDGDVNSVVINGVTYSGNAYVENKINHALADKQTVAAQGISCTGSQVIVAENKVLVADAISLKDNAATEVRGALCNSGTATITSGTFTGNAAESGGAIYNTGTATIENSVFVTATDTIYNAGGVLTLGGTIWTAAQIASTNAVAVKNNTSLVLDLSVYAGTTSQELLAGFDTMFGTSQDDLSISLNVAADQSFGTYVLATNAGTLAQSDFTVTVGNDAERNFIVFVNGGIVYDSKYYALKLQDDILSLTIQEQGNVGVVTVDGGTDSVIIAGSTYTGNPYRQEQIGQALADKQIVAAQNVTLSGFTVSAGQTFVGDNITMSETSAAIYNEGTMLLSGKITTAANITSTKAFTVESDTQLVLDFSARTADMKEMLTDYNTLFGESQRDLSITVNADPEQSSGVYTLATNAAKFDCPIALDIDNESVAPLDFVTQVVSGKRAYRLDWNNLDIQFIVKDVSDGKIFGGDTILSEDTAVSEVARLNIKEGSFVAAAGGVYATNCRVDINTDTNVSVADGSFSNIVCAGSIVNENTVLTVNDASRLTISGGTFANAVAGGNYIQSAGGTVYGGRGTRASNTFVTISGGTFLRDIFGGNIAAKNSFATKINNYITGSTNITIDTSENVVSISGNLVAGSSGVGQIIGSTNLTVTGNAENLVFGEKSIVCGDSHDATTAVSCVKRDCRFLTFDDFSGVFDAKVVGFDQVSLFGGSVTLTKSSRLNDVSVWNFSDDATLTFGDADNNFAGDRLSFGDFDGNEWTVMTGDDLSLANWDWADQVTIAGQNASFDDSLGCWTSADYKFYKEDNALKVAKLGKLA